MPTKTFSSYVLPGIFLGIMLLTFILGTWMLYERIRLGHQAAFEEAVAALPPFNIEEVSKEAAKGLGFAWPLRSPKFTFEAVSQRIDKILAETPEPGALKPSRKTLEDKYYVEAGYVKDSSGAWHTQEQLVKAQLEIKRKEFDDARAKDVEGLRKANSSGGFFPLDPPKEIPR